jgi:isocitrate dehydrogenase
MQTEVEAALNEAIANGPALAMVNSEKELQTFMFLQDVIVDASMPAMIRTSGQMYDKDGKQHDTSHMIPDRCYAGVYTATIDFAKHGALTQLQWEVFQT